MSFHPTHRLLPSRDKRDEQPCMRRTKDDRFIHTD